MKAKLVIVDDQIMFKEQFKAYIQASTYLEDKIELVYLSNGQEGLDYLLKNEVKFLVADVHMPILGGIEMLEKLHQKIPEKLLQMEVFVVTTETDKELMHKTREYGVKAWMIKPINFVSFLRILESKL